MCFKYILLFQERIEGNYILNIMSLKTDPPTLNLRGLFIILFIYLIFLLLLTLNYHNLKFNEETISENKFHYSSDELVLKQI